MVIMWCYLFYISPKSKYISNILTYCYYVQFTFNQRKKDVYFICMVNMEGVVFGASKLDWINTTVLDLFTCWALSVATLSLR